MKTNEGELVFFTIKNSIPRKITLDNNKIYKLEELLETIENSIKSNYDKENMINKGKYIYINNLKVVSVYDNPLITKDCKLVFSNCQFDRGYLSICSREVNIINPTFSESIEIFLNKSNKIFNMYANEEKAIRIYQTNACDKDTKILLAGCYYNLYLDIKNVNALTLSLTGNLNIKTNTNTLNLLDSKIFLTENKITTNKLKGNNFTLKSYNQIIINNDIYFSPVKNDLLTINGNDLLSKHSLLQARRKLISELKEIKENVDNLIEKKVNNEYELQHKRTKEDIDMYIKEIELLEEQITNIKNREKTNIQKTKAKLHNSSIKKIKG